MSLNDPDTLQRLLVFNYIDVAPLSLVAYDWFMTLEPEVSLVWPSKWGIIKVLYFLTRYLPFVDISLVPVYRTNRNIAVSTCITLYVTDSLFNVSGIIIAELILAIRTWALWKRSKRVGIVIVVLAISAIIPAYVICWEWMRESNLVYTVDPTVGCTQTNGSPIIAIDFILIIIWESAVLGLTLFSGLPSFRVDRGRSLLSVAYRDGVLFYIYLLAFSIVNITVVIAAPRLLAGILTTMQRAVHSCLSARVILNLREVERRELDQSLAINSIPLRDIKSRFEVRFARSDPSTLASSSSGGEMGATVTQ